MHSEVLLISLLCFVRLEAAWVEYMCPRIFLICFLQVVIEKGYYYYYVTVTEMYINQRGIFVHLATPINLLSYPWTTLV